MLVNVLFDDQYDDCDVISVPDNIGINIEFYAQKFCDWLNSGDITDEYYVTLNGKQYVSLETVGFVNWLNDCVCIDCFKCEVVAQHKKQNPKYKTVEF